MIGDGDRFGPDRENRAMSPAIPPAIAAQSKMAITRPKRASTGPHQSSPCADYYIRFALLSSSVSTLDIYIATPVKITKQRFGQDACGDLDFSIKQLFERVAVTLDFVLRAMTH